MIIGDVNLSRFELPFYVLHVVVQQHGPWAMHWPAGIPAEDILLELFSASCKCLLDIARTIMQVHVFPSCDARCWCCFARS